MITINNKLHQRLLLILLPLVIISACKKPDTVLPDGPKSLNVDATVPALIYSNVKDVYMDARRTISLNSKRETFFNWSCTVFPAASGLPVIIDFEKPLARVENPGIGQYVFKLTVKDNLGNIAESNYTLDVLGDTLTGKIPVAKAGPDQQINSPKNQVTLNAYETFDLNARGRTLIFKWAVIQKPVADFTFKFADDRFPITIVSGLIEGIYKIQLEVKNEIGLSAFDTMEIKVLPDPLKGTIRIFEDVVWQTRGGEWWDYYVAIQINEPDFFMNRFEGNMEVNVWDDEKKEWSGSNIYEWVSSDYEGLIIYYPYLGDDDAYYKMIGVKTRVRVKFL